MAGQNLENVKRRLGTVKSTLKITNAMKLVSSVKARKLQSVYDAKKKYSENCNLLLDSLLFYNEANPDCNFNSKLLLKNVKSKKTLFVVVTSNVGLCANYNNNVIRFLQNVYKKDDEVIVIGQKGVIELNAKNLEHIDDYVDLLTNFDENIVEKFVFDLAEKYKSDEYNKISIIYTHFINSIASKVEEKQLFPLDIKENKKRGYSPVFEPSKDEVIEFAIKKVVFANMMYYLFDSRVSEENARRNAMDNATKNGNELIDKLNLEYNKARQAAITQEITEVVAGSKSSK